MTNRDGRVLFALARFRIGRTTDLRRAVFPGVHRDTAGERLRKLFDAGYLNVRFADRSEENVYSLGSRAKTWLRSRGTAVAQHPRGDVDHHLGIVRMWICTVEAVRGTEGARLELARADWELRESAVQELYVVPDLLVRLALPAGGDRLLAMEVDLGNEPISTLRSKIGRYAELRRHDDGLYGLGGFHLCVFAPVGTATRRSTIRSLLEEATGESFQLWTQEDEIRAGLHRLLREGETPRTDSPYRTGTAPCLRSTTASDATPDEGGL